MMHMSSLHRQIDQAVLNSAAYNALISSTSS
uniref:Uncharacterized protein n=1 Tax=Arundo donax TaxID=35708 RepID=A0A0A9EK12_ARUDO